MSRVERARAAVNALSKALIEAAGQGEVLSGILVEAEKAAEAAKERGYYEAKIEALLRRLGKLS